MPRVGLTPVRVVEEAEAMVDAGGLPALTLAGVADRLGVRMPSLYKHVDSLDAVRRELGVRARRQLAEALRRATVGRSGPQALRCLAMAYRRWAREHPGRYATTVRAPAATEPDSVAASAEVYEIVAAALSEYRLDPVAEVDAIRALRAALHGFVAIEEAGGFGIPVDVDRSFARMVDALVVALAGWQQEARD